MNIKEILLKRYATKKFNPQKEISKENLENIKLLLQYSASSTNIQPWHFIIATTNEAKQRIIKSTSEKYPFNDHKIAEAPLSIIFCRKINFDEAYLSYLSDLEEKDGRFQNEQQKLDTHNGRKFFADMHKNQLNDVDKWFQSQLYLNIGFFLLGIATLGMDSVAMEGFDSDVIDKEFALKEKAFTSSCIVSLGYRDENDYNAALPKSRLSEEDIFTII